MSRTEWAPNRGLSLALPPCSSRYRCAAARELYRHAQLDSATLHLAERLSPYKNKKERSLVSKLPVTVLFYFCMAHSKII